MRTRFAFLVATFFISACTANGLEATESTDTQTSKQVLPKAAHSIKAIGGSFNRFLRSPGGEEDEERTPFSFGQVKNIMEKLKGKTMEEALHHLQYLRLPSDQREALLTVHLANAAKPARNA
ncbi:secreted RxLR effector peptide protein, putative [Phytophthora infestans T30-4]|uniref:RxLR effector protein n=1 Tax=Phytophthora infestans (strain T30-4) TaxID=403677 RepID=D0NNL3_PHYIT|nr:secreted RxLR effector peptide protein, putative [Phytophthora infestans T30-4]EEY62184.1 secreted RxLR effector peptide protein, putative [Phytophthora infestans T30-4]|eukprot:XP_002899215.1 secreted RxLR effector peptide protein, putative [Phytophthora infestans T30-4]